MKEKILIFLFTLISIQTKLLGMNADWRTKTGYLLGGTQHTKSRLIKEPQYQEPPPPAESKTIAPELSAHEPAPTTPEKSLITPYEKCVQEANQLAARMAEEEPETLVILSKIEEEPSIHIIRPYAAQFSKTLQTMISAAGTQAIPILIEIPNNEVHFLVDLLNALLLFTREQKTKPCIANYITKIGDLYRLSFSDIAHLIFFFDIPIALDAISTIHKPIPIPTTTAQEITYNDELIKLYETAQSTTENYRSCIGCEQFWQLLGRMLYTGCLQHQPIQEMVRKLQSRSVKSAIKKIKTPEKRLSNHLKHHLEKQSKIHHIVEHLVIGGYMQEHPNFYQKLLLTIEAQNVHTICFSPNSKYLAAGMLNGSITIYDVENGAPIKRLAGHEKMINSLCYSPDGETILSASNDHTIRLWNVETGECIQQYTGHRRIVHNACFNANGTLIASACEDGTICLWTIQSSQPIQQLRGDCGAATTVCFDQTNSKLIAGYADHRIRIWDIQSGTITNILANNSDHINCVCCSADGSIFASASSDNSIHIYDMQTATIRQAVHHNAPVSSISFSEDSSILLSGSLNNSACLWNTLNGSIIHTFTTFSDAITSVAFSPNGRLIAAGSRDNSIKIWGQKSLYELLAAPIQ